jgi:hypothetical protein
MLLDCPYNIGLNHALMFIRLKLKVGFSVCIYAELGDSFCANYISDFAE